MGDERASTSVEPLASTLQSNAAFFDEPKSTHVPAHAPQLAYDADREL